MLNYCGMIGKIQVQVLENLIGVAAWIGSVEHVQAWLDYNNDIQTTEAILITVAGKQDEAVETMRAVFGSSRYSKITEEVLKTAVRRYGHSNTALLGLLNRDRSEELRGD